MHRVAIIGAGEIGSGWAALFASHQLEVRVYDPDPAAEARTRRSIADARRVGLPSDESLVRFVSSADEAADGAEWIQESVPEDAPLKRRVLSTADRGAADAIVASSTSSYTAGELAEGLPVADRFLIAHPLHPVFVVPVVELSASPTCEHDVLDRAVAFLRTLGREPVVVRGDLRGLVSNRLTAAVLREAIELVASGAVSAEELDDVVARGVATGWMAAGVFGTERLGSGDDGGADAAARVERQLAPLLDSLAGWTHLAGYRRSALERSLRDSADSASGALDWPAVLTALLRSRSGRGAG